MPASPARAITSGMRVLRVLSLCFAACVSVTSTAHAQEGLPALDDGGGRLRLEMSISGERHWASFLAETPTGGEASMTARLWTGGFDLCPAAVVTPWLDLGGCLGVHIGASQVPDEDTQWFGDTTPAFMGRAMLRSVFRAPRFVRGGLDLVYRSYVSEGRESALEAGIRFGVELATQEGRPFYVELGFRAPLVVTRSESTYAWRIRELSDGSAVYDIRPTREVRFYTLGLQVGTYWTLLR